jgi:hypothetical protein
MGGSTGPVPGGSGVALSEYLSPMSKMKWGPFSVIGLDAFASWSNQPLGLNGETTGASLAEANGIATPGSTIGSHVSASMGARWRWGTGFIGFQYVPSMDYQTAIGVRQYNQNISLLLDHPFQVGKWRLTFGVRTATANQYSEMYNPPTLVPLVGFEVPITNLDLVGLLNQPQPLQPPTPQSLFVSTRFYTGSASAALARKVGARDTLSITLVASMNHVLDFGQQTGALFNYPQSSGGTATLTFGHMISPRMQWTASLLDSQAFGGGIGIYAAQEQSAQLGWSWTPFRKFGFTASAGPARVFSPANGADITAAGSVSMSYTPFTGSSIVWGYSRGLDFTGFAGGQQSQRVNLTWNAPQLRGKKWHYSLTTNYTLGQSVSSYTGQPGQYAVGNGISATFSFYYPITRQLIFSANYGYLDQNVVNVQNNSSGLANFQRNLVSMGLHYSFAQQGGQGTTPVH